MPFASLGLSPLVVKGVRAAGYVQPTPIQSKAIPIILEGKDLIGAAQTGTGKTAAFVLPILTRLLGGPRRLRVLVLTPTRELAAQVETNARDYARFTDLRVGVVYGGVPIPPQERMLKQIGVDFLVATPGRLLDLHDRLALRLDYIEVLVLDEADRMVDMGFAPDLKRILRLMPRDRQTLMFSATMPPDLNRVAQEALRHPARVDLAPPQRPAAGITQAVYPVPRHLKTDLLDSMLSRSEVSSVIVFARTKHGADKLARDLQRRGHSVATLHGNRSQSQRERALGDLRRGRVQVLVATDIASRGIDVEGITHVINYDVPHAPEDYVHRIGRTGRVDAVGDAFTLIAPEEQKQLTAIERFLGRSVPRVILPDFDYKQRPAQRKSAPFHPPRGRTGPHPRGRTHGASGHSTQARPQPAQGVEPQATHGRRPRKSHGIDRRNRGRI
ncbi:MAG: DEAD/DEAH box helicase [Candidatus Eisenbacteria bacterium]|uniref:DEAD/DEAH box helicase n=1 Tax=Eiseniibacteriota bacterium TaxID=2212470 RepID=A0A538SPP8_UNCEI|nr:MAG: DEAD/DEAH box helicase [Candidatus Eisenbacteria bacterium]TMQ61904.1 MAG: DEAD/DEAH box helicase [Candidatus Eisenbacteria bacterium]